MSREKHAQVNVGCIYMGNISTWWNVVYKWRYELRGLLARPGICARNALIMESLWWWVGGWVCGGVSSWWWWGGDESEYDFQMMGNKWKYSPRSFYFCILKTVFVPGSYTSTRLILYNNEGKIALSSHSLPQYYIYFWNYSLLLLLLFLI